MDVSNSGIWAIVVAAGRGERLGLPYNKVFMRLAGRSLLSRCFDALAAADVFEGAVLVLSDGDEARYQALCREEGAPALIRRVVGGGENRQASVLCGLRALPEGARMAAIHDCARAFVPASVVRDCVRSALEHGSGVAATMVSDTVKRVDEQGRSVETPERARLRAVQTPQAFALADILKAHEMAAADGFVATDDAALAERYIGPVRLCCSDEGLRNVKITTMEDVRRMEALLSGEPRVGHGYDVHRLVPDRRLVLCGVEVPHETGLLGHSDADVASHALMDALLGAAGLGDIGRHFPDTDARYGGADSLGLLREVVRKLADSGYAPGNADVTIVCQRPKLAPFMGAMRANIAGALGIDPARVNVKATTTEGLGFEGEGEGISASAVAMVYRTRS